MPIFDFALFDQKNQILGKAQDMLEEMNRKVETEYETLKTTGRLFGINRVGSLDRAPPRMPLSDAPNNANLNANASPSPPAPPQQPRIQPDYHDFVQHPLGRVGSDPAGGVYNWQQRYQGADKRTVGSLPPAANFGAEYHNNGDPYNRAQQLPPKGRSPSPLVPPVLPQLIERRSSDGLGQLAAPGSGPSRLPPYVAEATGHNLVSSNSAPDLEPPAPRKSPSPSSALLQGGKKPPPPAGGVRVFPFGGPGDDARKNNEKPAMVDIQMPALSGLKALDHVGTPVHPIGRSPLDVGQARIKELPMVVGISPAPPEPSVPSPAEKPGAPLEDVTSGSDGADETPKDDPANQPPAPDADDKRPPALVLPILVDKAPAAPNPDPSAPANKGAPSPPQISTASSNITSPSTPEEAALAQIKISAGDVEIDKSRRLGAGGFGEVYEGVLWGYNEVAVKVIKGSVDEKTKAAFKKEIVMWNTLRHRNGNFMGDARIKVLGGVGTDLSLSDLASRLAHGLLRRPADDDLRARQKREPPQLPFSTRLEHQARSQVVEGRGEGDGLFAFEADAGAPRRFERLVSPNRTNWHRTLTSFESPLKNQAFNILIDGAGGDRALITDFGMSRIREHIALTTSGIGWGGTPGFMAPELYTQSLKPPADVFAFGMVCYEVVSRGKFPFYEAKGNQPTVGFLFVVFPYPVLCLKAN